MSTKNRSAGTQFTEKGVVQGVSIVDDSGNPYDSVVDGDGVRRLAVDANVTIGSAVINVDLDASTDSVSIQNSNNSNELLINADGSLNITDNSGSLTVDAVNLDIRDLSHTQDSIKIGDGVDLLAINADGSINSSSKDIYSLVPHEIDEIQITSKNLSGDPLVVVYKKTSSTVATLTLTYDIDGDLQSVVRS